MHFATDNFELHFVYLIVVSHTMCNKYVCGYDECMEHGKDTMLQGNGICGIRGMRKLFSYDEHSIMSWTMCQGKILESFKFLMFIFKHLLYKVYMVLGVCRIKQV